MNLFKRLRNIYRLSEYQIPVIGQNYEVGDLIVPELFKPVEKPRMAEIIKLKKPVDQALEE